MSGLHPQYFCWIILADVNKTPCIILIVFKIFLKKANEELVSLIL